MPDEYDYFPVEGFDEIVRHHGDASFGWKMIAQTAASQGVENCKVSCHLVPCHFTNLLPSFRANQWVLTLFLAKESLPELHLPVNSRLSLAIRCMILMFSVMMAGTLLSHAAYAQRPESVVLAKQKPLIAEYITTANALAASFETSSDTDEGLVEIRNKLIALEEKILASAVEFRPRMNEINSRLDQLGEPPASGTVEEPEAVTAERNFLLAEKAEINQLIGEAESASVRVNNLIEDIGTRRRELFAQALSKRYDINASVLINAASEFGQEVSELWRRVSSWLRFIVRFKLQSVVGATFIALAAAFLLMIGGRKIAASMTANAGDIASPTFLERISVAFWATLLPTLVLGVFAYTTLQLYKDFGLFRDDLGTIIVSIVDVTIVVYLVHRLALLILAPWNPAWRLVKFGNEPSKQLYWLVVATAGITGLDLIMSTVNDVLSSPLNLTVAKTLVATVIVAVLILMIGNAKPTEDADGKRKPWPMPVRYLLYLIGLVPLAASFLGYVGLARFALQQIVVTGAVVVTMYVGFLASREIAAENAFLRTSEGQWLKKRFKYSDTTIDQIGVASGILTNFIVLLIGLPLILLQWGFQWGDIRTWAVKILSGVQVGSITISFFGILSGIAIFIVAFALMRWFQRWLDGTVMARSKMDSGVRNSIRTAIGYVGFVVAALFGVSAAGIELQNLALIAGGLSLGIGFGLQNIVSNFVSGLILLAERPFKAGDWIVAGNVSGFVKKISVRATEIETFQRQTVILPNSELINAAVGNWTHRNRTARIEIAVGVAYGTDARRVRDILMTIATEHPLVLKNPEPAVVFTSFGESSLDFELRIFLLDVFDLNVVQSEIRFSILDAFAAENIEIPFPQRDITIKGGPVVEALDKALPKTRKPPARGRSRRSADE